MRARGFSTASGAPAPAAPLQCPGLDSFYSGMDAPTANCSICFQKRRLHLSFDQSRPVSSPAAVLLSPPSMEASAAPSATVSVPLPASEIGAPSSVEAASGSAPLAVASMDLSSPVSFNDGSQPADDALRVSASEAQAAAAAQARAADASQITLESNAVNASAEAGPEVPDLIAHNQMLKKVMCIASHSLQASSIYV